MKMTNEKTQEINLKMDNERIQKLKNKLVQFPGDLEDIFRSIPDVDMLRAFREEEFRKVRNNFNLLIRKLTGLEKTDFGEELGLYALKQKEEIHKLSNGAEKAKALQKFIEHLEVNYNIEINIKDNEN